MEIGTCPYCGLPDRIKVSAKNGYQCRHSDMCVDRIIEEEIIGLKEGWIIISRGK